MGDKGILSGKEQMNLVFKVTHLLRLTSYRESCMKKDKWTLHVLHWTLESCLPKGKLILSDKGKRSIVRQGTNESFLTSDKGILSGKRQMNPIWQVTKETSLTRANESYLIRDKGIPSDKRHMNPIHEKPMKSYKRILSKKWQMNPTWQGTK